jgi:hypothetical protein
MRTPILLLKYLILCHRHAAQVRALFSCEQTCLRVFRPMLHPNYCQTYTSHLQLGTRMVFRLSSALVAARVASLSSTSSIAHSSARAQYIAPGPQYPFGILGNPTMVVLSTALSSHCAAPRASTQHLRYCKTFHIYVASPRICTSP